MKTQRVLFAFLVAQLLAPVVLPIGLWFVLLLLPATVLLIPALLIWGIAMLAALILSASHSGQSMASIPGPPGLNNVVPAT